MDDNQKEERGPKIPGVNLQSAIDLLRRVRDGVGVGRASRETIAQALGYSSLNGSSKRAIAALGHFGLMERAGSSALRVSDLGSRILVPRDEQEQREAIAEAAQQPALYQKLFSRYGGHGLPALLPNILVRDFGVLASSSEEIVRTFRESVEFAGLLRNGILHTALEPAETHSSSEVPPSSDGMSAEVEDQQAGPGPPTNHPTAARPPVGGQRYTIPLDRQGRLATIEIPLPVSSSDLRRVSRWAEFMLTMSEEDE
jgi:hypothetical protein